MNRTLMLQQLKANPDKIWDVIIVGGGATGLGAAVDAASRGFDTLLVEQSDFAKGTSSRSTKLVHGGVRYLAQGDLSLVFEALHERRLLLENAPHLVRNQRFIIPVYEWWEGPFYNIGMKVYDLMAGKLGLGPSQNISKDAKHLLDGVQLLDVETNERFPAKGKTVVNAAGVFVRDIEAMDAEKAERSVILGRGVHIVLDRSFLQGDSAIMIPHTSDGRVLFVVPWHDRAIN